jgi:predicted nucleotide-binding protein
MADILVVWGIIRGTLRDRFSFSQIKDIVGRAGLPVERLSHLTQGLRGASKGQLMDAIDGLVQELSVPQRETFVTLCIEDMIKRNNQVIDDLQILNRHDWTLVGGIFRPPSKRQSEDSTFEESVELSPKELVTKPIKHSRYAPARKQFDNDMSPKALKPKGDRVFIGHGGSHVWLILQNFLTQGLHLKCDEFNREPTAGVHNVERLEQMLDAACFAFIVMTAEDEHSDGTKHARANVIHEAGLFQGRLGFKKSIILLEEGCADFSNIDGLTHIPFPKGKIMACSEDIRRTLTREGVLKEFV